MNEVWSYFLEFQGERFKLDGRDLVVGRSRTCDVAIQDPSVSRRHVQVTPRSGKIILTDLGSSNGTFVNGERISGGSELADGDVLGLGDADVTIRILPKAAFETMRMPKASIPEVPEVPAAAETGEVALPSFAPAPPAGGEPAAEEASFSDVLGSGEAPASADVRDSIPEVGEATGILQAASVQLARDALRETPEESDTQEMPEPGAPGSHMAPPPPSASFAAPQRPSPEPPDMALGFDENVPALTTQVVKTVGPMVPAIELPDAPETPAGALEPSSPRESPGETVEPAPPETLQPEIPAFTQPIPTIAPSPRPSSPAVEAPAPPAAEPAAGPGITQPLPGAPVPELLDSPQITQPLPTVPPPELADSPQVTQKLPSMAPAAPPPSPVAKIAGPPVPSQPLEDIREAASHPAPAADGPSAVDEPVGSSELLSSLDGFDTTLTPGVPIPESMQRARETMAQREAEAIEEPLPSPYQQPALQAPPAAGFGIRAVAVVLDGIWTAALGAVGWLTLGQLGAIVAGGVTLVVVLAGWTIWGTTPGKRMLGLYIYTADGQAGLGFGRAAMRLVASFLSLALAGIGFLMALSSSKRTLHDRIAGTYVRHYR